MNSFDSNLTEGIERVDQTGSESIRLAAITKRCSVPPVVLVHDYLIQMGGAEQTVAALHRAYPAAPIYTSVVDRKRLMHDFDDAEIIETRMRSIPRIEKDFKKYFFLYPFAFQLLGRIPARLAIVSSSGFSKWARFAPGCITVCYCYTPPRFFWSPDEYLKNEIGNGLLRGLVKLAMTPFRRADYRAAQKMDHLIAISNCVQQRIKDYYGRDSTVIYPPVGVKRFTPTPTNEGYYLVVSRLVAYKRIDIVVEAFAKNGKKLIVVGTGPDRRRLEKMSAPNIHFTGWVSEAEVVRYMERSYALVFPGLEDFGITPVEANACGKPVLAFAGGGALETIQSGQSGLFFDVQSPDALNGALPAFEAIAWDPHRIRKLAERFDEDVFLSNVKMFISSKTKN